MADESTTTRHLDNDVAVHSTGAGASIVALHANGGDWRDFDGIAVELGERYRLHRVDWPGHGESVRREPMTAFGFAELLPKLLEEIPGGPHVLLGNSVGGFAAISCAAQRPDLVKALLLVNPGGFTWRTPASWLTCRFIGTTFGARLAMRQLPRRYIRTRTPFAQELIERSKAAAADPQAVRTYASIWKSFNERQHNATVFASKVVAPTLLVWGRRDPVLPWLLDGKRAQRHLRLAEVATFDCGHQAFVELPEEFLRVATPFLELLDAKVGT